MHSSSSQKMNIGVSRDMQSTNYTIKKQIQIHCELVRPTSCHKSHFKNRSVFGNTVVWLNVRHYALILFGIKINRRSVIQFDNPRSASIQTSQSVTTLEILPSAKQVTLQVLVTLSITVTPPLPVTLVIVVIPVIPVTLVTPVIPSHPSHISRIQIIIDKDLSSQSSYTPSDPSQPSNPSHPSHPSHTSHPSESSQSS